MKLFFLSLSLIILFSCNGNKRNEESGSKENDKIVLIATTPDGKEIKQVISKEEMNQLGLGLSGKLKRDTILNEFNKPKKIIHNLVGKTVYEYFEYNTEQQIISRQGLKSDSSPIEIYNEVSKIEYQYKNSLLVEERKFNINNELISSQWEDTPVIKYKYNSKNKLTEEWFLNEKGELRDEYSILRYKKIGKDYDWYNIKGDKKIK